MFRKKFYKVRFTVNFIPIQKYRFLPDYIEINPLYLEDHVRIFCEENNIKCKKIKIHNCLSDLESYVRIYGTKNDQIKLYDFLRLSFSKYLKVIKI